MINSVWLLWALSGEGSLDCSCVWLAGLFQPVVWCVQLVALEMKHPDAIGHFQVQTKWNSVRWNRVVFLSLSLSLSLSLVRIFWLSCTAKIGRKTSVTSSRVTRKNLSTTIPQGSTSLLTILRIPTALIRIGCRQSISRSIASSFS